MKDIFWNKHRKFSIRKLKIGIASVTVGLVFVNSVIGMNHVEAALSVEDSNYINETAVNNGALVEYIRQALATISKAANSTVLSSSIQNLKDKVQALSTKKEADYTESAWQEFQGKLTTAKSVLAEAEKAYNKAVTINPNAQSYETTINELITSYPEYNTVVIKVREGETTETAENRHLTNIRRINGVLTAKYSELSETAQSLKTISPSFGEDLATQQLNIIASAENILEVNKKTKTFAETEHADLMAGLFENHKVTLSELSSLRGTITSADQSKITAFLESHNPSVGETAVFQTYVGALQYKFNNDGTVTITYTDDGSSDTVPLSIFAKGGSTQTDSPAATYSVTYNYVSGTPDKTLPSSITAPAAVSDKHTGDVVASPSGQTDVEDAANQGTWHFNGWDKASVTVGTSDETVTGTWTFTATPVATYRITYNYVSGTPDKTLPSNITAPAAVSDKHTGDVVASPSGQTDVEDAANQGTWHFNGWDKASVTVGTSDETVTGTWTFTVTPGEKPSTTPGTTTPGEKPDTTPGTATPGENPSTTPGTTTPGENPGTTPGTATPGENPSTIPGTITPGENPSTTPGTAMPGENPGTTPGTAIPGDTPSTTPGTTTPGENPSTTPGTTTPGENPGTTPGTAIPGDTPSTTPGTAIPGDTPSTTPDTAPSGDTPSTTPDTAPSGDTPSTTPGTATPGENPSTTPGTITPRTTDLYVSGREGNTLSNSVAEEWSEKDSHWFYQLEDNSYIANEWKQINGTWYRFDNSGLMQTGWVKDNGTWYYLNQSGAMQTGWVKDNGTWYYLNDSGAMQTGWIQDNGTWYYLNDSGAMQTGWVKDNGTWYYLNDSGAMQTGWIQDNDTWYYLNQSGAMQTGWVKDNDTWYYLDNSGAMKTGWFTVSGKWYYAYSSGALAVDTTVDGYTVNVNGEWV